MAFRYRAIVVLTLALLLLTVPATAKRAHRPPHPAARPTSVESIYSQRALRRARIILQLKLLELKSERLERVRKAILRNLPIDLLMNQG